MVGGYRSINCLRGAAKLAGLLLAAVAPVAAQTLDAGRPPADGAHTGIVIGGTSLPAPTLERCVEVEVGNERSFGCLNERLKREVDRINPSINMPPIDARSPDIRVGNVNEAAVRQQYGPNYGRSAIPYRPATPTYTLPRR
jgi:hypothetical protein